VVSKNDKRFLKLNKLGGELLSLTTQSRLFELTKNQKDEWTKKVQKVTDEIKKYEKIIEEIKSNIIYEKAFEWRFEFPEVLNDNAEFAGFDIIIGNPPFIPLEAFDSSVKEYFKQKFPIFERKYETSVLFINNALDLLKDTGILSMIAPGTWQTGENYVKFREYLIHNKGINLIINLPFNIFEDAFIDTSIYVIDNKISEKYRILNFNKKEIITKLSNLNFANVLISRIQSPNYKLILDDNVSTLFTKYQNENFISLGDITISTQGLSGSNFSAVQD
jgi:hypothetical protein